MSHYTTVVETSLTDAHALQEALLDMGFEKVRLHDEPTRLRGFEDRPLAHVTACPPERGSNAIGFRRRSNGTYDAVVPQTVGSGYDADWLNELTRRHSYHLARRKLEEQGFSLVQEECAEDGRIHLLLRRTV